MRRVSHPHWGLQGPGSQRKMAVNGCFFESECLCLCSVVCIWHASVEQCVFENGRPYFFGRVKGQNGMAG